MRNIWYWIIALLIFSFIDYTCTSYGIHQGFFREANPIMNWVIQKFGVEGILVVKLIMIWLLALGIVIPSKFRPSYMKRTELYVKIVTVAQGAICFWGLVLTLLVIYG